MIRQETRWNLKCVYPRRKLETVKYQASVGFKDVEAKGDIPTEMLIFDSNYISPLPEPVVFNLGDTVYIEVRSPYHQQKRAASSGKLCKQK